MMQYSMFLVRFLFCPLVALSLLVSIVSCQVAEKKLRYGKNRHIPSMAMAPYIDIAAKVRCVIDGKDQSCQVKLHIHKDHMIWFSISSWGIEVLRGKWVPTRLELINPLKKWYKVYDRDDIEQFLQLPCTFYFAQAVLLGDFPHLAHTKVQRREAGKHVELWQQQNKWTYRASKLKDSGQLDALSIEDNRSHTRGHVSYSYTPDALLSLIKMSSGSFKLSLQYNRIRPCNQPLPFSFNIPQHYERF